MTGRDNLGVWSLVIAGVVAVGCYSVSTNGVILPSDIAKKVVVDCEDSLELIDRANLAFNRGTDWLEMQGIVDGLFADIGSVSGYLFEYREADGLQVVAVLHQELLTQTQKVVDHAVRGDDNSRPDRSRIKGICEDLTQLSID